MLLLVHQGLDQREVLVGTAFQVHGTDGLLLKLFEEIHTRVYSVDRFVLICNSVL